MLFRSGYTYPLQRQAANLGPLSSSVFVIVNKFVDGDIRDINNFLGSDFLKPPDCKYFTYTGKGTSPRKFYIVDPRYSANSLDYSQINVYNNGIQLLPVSDFIFDSATNSITLAKGVASVGDEIIIEVLTLADYQIINGFLVINQNNYSMINAGLIILNTFTNQDRKSTRLNSSHTDISRMPSSA